MKIRSTRRQLQVFDLPARAVFLPGRGTSRELTEVEQGHPDIQKALKRKWVRLTR